MNKIQFMRLWDIYKGLLTPTQQEITDLYFNLDLTVSEIAEEKGISRQGVSECLKTCKNQLEDYEERLRFSKWLTEICLEESFKLTDLSGWAEKFRSNHPELSAETDELLRILDKDYQEEVNAALQDEKNIKLLNADYRRS